MKPKKPTYKPLLFTTTLRNLGRLRNFLAVLRDYDGMPMSDGLAEEIAANIICLGLYRPNNTSASAKEKIKQGVLLSQREAQKIMKENPQRHEQGGFSRGWPSRFNTWFQIAKELGFVYYKLGEKVKFSATGHRLVNAQNFADEQAVFCNAFAKYQRDNPFLSVLNSNIPLALLLAVIKKLNADPKESDAGISKSEIPLLLYWKDHNAHALYLRIKQLRKEHGLSPSWEVILDICQKEIMGNADIKRKSASTQVDYPDEFIRKMRLTGLISLRGHGRFIDINRNEEEKVAHILRAYSTPRKYSSEREYFEHMSTVDKVLIRPLAAPAPRSQVKHLEKWVKVFEWEVIKSEMLILLQKKEKSADNILRYMTHPVRFEFLTALAVKSRFPKARVVPNYPVDDEGLPTSTAPGAGDTGDIECCEGKNGILLEVTMTQGRTQTVAEIWPIARHLEKFQNKTGKAMCFFVAPSIYKDSERQIRFLKWADNLFVCPKTISGFLKHLEKSDSLFVRDDEKK